MQDETPESDIEALVKANKWRQGDLLPAEAQDAIATLVGPSFTDQHLGIVVTHSCDLDRPDSAFTVEIVVASITGKKLNGSVAHSRSRKKLQIEVLFDDAKQAIEIRASDRYELPLEMFAQFAPDRTRILADDLQREILVEWLVARYARPGFPNAFEQRLGSDKKKVEALKVAAERLHLIPRIYVGLTPWEEIKEDQSYLVEIFFVMNQEDFKGVEKRKEALAAISGFLQVLRQFPGIIVEQDENDTLRSDDDFTLYETRKLRRWQRFDFISFKEPEHIRENND